MKNVLMVALVLSSLAARADLLPIQFRIEGQGTIGNQSNYKTLGSTFVPSATNELSKIDGGYYAVLGRFRSSAPVKGDLYEQAKAFRSFVMKNYGIVVDAEVYVMRFAIDAIVFTKTDAEIPGVLKQVAPHLSFQQKVAWLAQLGGLFARNYDYSRVGKGENSAGEVSLRQLLTAAQNSTKAGVCRDMHKALAILASQMGLKSYVQAMAVTGEHHAVTVIQDPENPNRVYTINYANVTANESTSSTALTRQDGTIPQTGIQAEYSGSRGQYLSAFPTALGLTLNDMAGGNPGDWDKLLRNYDSQAVAMGELGTLGLSLGAGYARTEDGSDVIGAVFRSTNKSKYLSGRMGVVIYQQQGATSLYGDMTQQGIYVSGHERVTSKPQRIPLDNGSAIEMRIVGEINFAAQIQQTKIVGYKEGTEVDQMFNARMGGTADYRSADGKTGVSASALATGEVGANDVSDSAGMKQFRPQFRDATISLTATQLLASEIEGFVNTDVVIRNPELGSQAREEVGVRRVAGPLLAGSVAVGHEGPLTSTRPAFVPGNIPKYYVEASISTRNQRLGLRSGVYCLASDMSTCAVRGQGRLSIPLKKGRLLPF